MKTIPNDSMHKRTHTAFHKLWTKAVGTPDYNKQEWRDLETALKDLGWREMAFRAVGRPQ